MTLRIGVDLGGTKTEVNALGARGAVLDRRREPTPSHDYPAAIALIARMVKRAEVQVGQRASIGGEWGHNPLPWPLDSERPGPACFCGRHGCIETFRSGPGLVRDHAAHTGETLVTEEIVRRAATNDAAAEASLARYEGRLARALATVINVIDPDSIVLGGGLSNLERLYVNVPRLWLNWIFSDVVRTRLERNMHGDSSGVRGAAWLWPTDP